jgi:hypothetical protein
MDTGAPSALIQNSLIQSRRKYDTRFHQPLFARSRGAGKDGDPISRYLVSDRGNSDSFWAAPARIEGSQEEIYAEKVLATDRRVRLITARNTAVIGA